VSFRDMDLKRFVEAQIIMKSLKVIDSGAMLRGPDSSREDLFYYVFLFSLFCHSYSNLLDLDGRPAPRQNVTKM